VRPLRPSGHLIQLMPQSALPEVPGERRAQNGWLRARLNCARIVFPRCLHSAHELSALALQNKRLLYDCSNRTSAATMLELARDPKHSEPTSDSSACSIPGDRTSNIIPMFTTSFLPVAWPYDGSRWIDSSRRFFLPVHALSRVFRGKFAAGLKQLYVEEKLQFHGSQQYLAAPGSFPTSSATVPSRTGWSTPSPLWRRRPCAQLPGPLYPSRGHLQPSPRGLRERASLFPLARLCSRQ